MNKKRIKDWELEKGIKLRNTNGFEGERNKIHNARYSEKQFKRGAIKSELVCNTEKGIDFLCSR